MAPFSRKCLRVAAAAHLGFVTLLMCVQCCLSSLGLWINAGDVLSVRHLTCLVFFFVTCNIPPQTAAAKKTKKNIILVTFETLLYYCIEDELNQNFVLKSRAPRRPPLLNFFAAFRKPLVHAAVLANETVNNTYVSAHTYFLNSHSDLQHDEIDDFHSLTTSTTRTTFIFIFF